MASPPMVFEDIRLAGGLHLSVGLLVGIPMLAIHPYEFKPECFAAGRHPALLPFASGPRNCVSQVHALVEAKIVLAMMLQHFRLSLPGSLPVPAVRQVALPCGLFARAQAAMQTGERTSFDCFTRIDHYLAC